MKYPGTSGITYFEIEDQEKKQISASDVRTLNTALDELDGGIVVLPATSATKNTLAERLNESIEIDLPDEAPFSLSR